MAESIVSRPLGQGRWQLIDERGGVMYLVTGKERALLIDTGFGVGDLVGALKALTHLPIVVVNTHAHADHIQGNGQFDEVRIHELDVPLIQHTETTLIPIRGGHLFQLGDRTVEVIAVPGHTPGSICLLDRITQTLFTGDSPRSGPLWMHLPTSLTLAELRNSLLHLLGFRALFDTLAPAHGDPMPAETLIDDLLACAEGVLIGEIVGHPHSTRFGDCLLAEYGSAAIMYLPEKLRPARAC